MFIKDLNGAKPVDYKFETTLFCPPDCGGEEEDIGEYVAYCPECHKNIDKRFGENYCYNCGTKLFWGYKVVEIEDKV